jgi:LPS-assembly protein
VDDQRTIIRNATIPPASAGRSGWMPTGSCAPPASAWTRRKSRHGQRRLLSFKGVPILPVPALSFPLGDKRKSGVLPPTIGIDSRSGLEVTLPYYWNIAPNRDATLFPTLMTKRGIDLGAEFRYLEPGYPACCAATTCPTTGCATATAGASPQHTARHEPAGRSLNRT